MADFQRTKSTARQLIVMKQRRRCMLSRLCSNKFVSQLIPR